MLALSDNRLGNYARNLYPHFSKACQKQVRSKGRVVNDYRIVWEDEAKAREVEIVVDFTVAAGTVEIDTIRPTKVTFYNAETKAAERSIGIHTDTARTMLSDAYLASRPADSSLAAEIYSAVAAHDEMGTEQLAS